MTFPTSNDIPKHLFHVLLSDVTDVLLKELPQLQELCIRLLDVVFIPKVMFRQLLLWLALETGLLTMKQLLAVLRYVLSTIHPRARLIRHLERQQFQTSTKTLDEWMELAERIDQIQGNDKWRLDPSCPLYEEELIQARITEIVHLMRRQDVFELIFVLRGSMGRNKFGLLHKGLFSKALAGTKILVETYHNVVCAALDFICDSPLNIGEEHDREPIPTDVKLAFFNETRHAYGRTALLCSGGGSLGIYHFGVIKALVAHKLMPRVLGGSSAGSIVCACVATRTDEEVLDGLVHLRGTHALGHSGKLVLNFFQPKLRALRREEDDSTFASRIVPRGVRHLACFVWDILTGSQRLRDVLKSDTVHLRECIRADVGDFTFQEAFQRTGRILNIVVTPSNRTDPPRLLNYLTAPHVMIWSAALASSSLPGVFESIRLVVKEANGWERYESIAEIEQTFFDGSMEQDLPMAQLSEMFNINHFIISQVNPHAVMFASYNQDESVWSSPFIGLLSSLLTFVKNQMRSWITHVFKLIGGRQIAPLFETQRGYFSAIFTQEYRGRSSDISLVPWLHHKSLLGALSYTLSNLSEAEFFDWVAAAERETWRHIPAIKSHIAEEVTLDRCVQRLRQRVVQEAHHQDRSHPGIYHYQKTDRVPSFFTTPSSLNLNGHVASDTAVASTLNTTAPMGINPGWGGLGLRGNRSTGTLTFHEDCSKSSMASVQNGTKTWQQFPGQDTSCSV